MEQLLLAKNEGQIQIPWIRFVQRIQFIKKQSKHALWQDGNFRLFLTSEGAGLFGNNFFQIALPLMVKEYTGSTGAISIAIILSGVSRMSFMMIGGVLCDRFSPRQLILTAGVFRLALLAVITAIPLTGQMNLLALYGFSFATGMADAIFVPARGALMPMLVGQELLKAANAIASAQEKIWSMVGPAIAGLVISWISRSSSGGHSVAILGPSAAFLVDILAISLSIIVLRPVKFARPVLDDNVGSDSVKKEGSLRDLIRLIRQKSSLRVPFLMVYAINCLSSGPLYIGLPILAVSRFPEGAEALGFLTSALGGGALMGILAAGILPQPRSQQLGRVFLTVIGGLAAGLVVLGLTVSVVPAILAVMAIAALISYVNITGVVQIQSETPPAFLGRMMGLLNLK